MAVFLCFLSLGFLSLSLSLSFSMTREISVSDEKHFNIRKSRWVRLYSFLKFEGIECRITPTKKRGPLLVHTRYIHERRYLFSLLRYNRCFLSISSLSLVSVAGIWWFILGHTPRGYDSPLSEYGAKCFLLFYIFQPHDSFPCQVCMYGCSGERGFSRGSCVLV